MEAFKIKNGLSAKRYLGSTTTLSGSTIDLSLGSMFSTTLSSDPAYTFTNPPASGNAQAFSVEVTGGTTTFTNDSFATTLYTGNASTQTITNGLDLATDGGLVWIRDRGVANHGLFDTERGVNQVLSSNQTIASTSTANSLTAFNADGFSIGSNTSYVNNNGAAIVSWSFKKQAKFFDVVTWTGDGVAGREIAHDLGTTVGTIIVKRTDITREWGIYHRSLGGTDYLSFDTDASASAVGFWNNTEPTSTGFTVGVSNTTNASGGTYVAYLFAHDTASDSRIKCGSYTGNGGVGVNSITLGWKPQWILLKNASATGSWAMYDTVRGWVDSASDSDDARLFANSNGAESLGNAFGPTATGFEFKSGNLTWNNSGNDFVYIAIRASAATDSAITWPSSVKWPAGVAPTTPAPGTKDLFTFLTTDGGTTYYGKKAAEGLA